MLRFLTGLVRAQQKKTPRIGGARGSRVSAIGGGTDLFLLWRSKNEKSWVGVVVRRG
jgi:hypothetical protein